jgi:hypothetical protein
MRLASLAGAGENLVSAATDFAGGMQIQGLQNRQLELKGKSEFIGVHVMHAHQN